MSRGSSFGEMTGIQHHSYLPTLRLSAFLLCFGLIGANAAEVRHHEAHVHGIGKLNVALDGGGDLIIELTSPAANVVGFEHAPENEQQTHEVNKAIDLLKEGDTLFVFSPNSQCTLHEAHVENDMGQVYHEEHASHEHEAAHSGEKHDGESTHSDFEITYHFQCDDPKSLQTIDVLLFSHFPGFEELEVQLLTPKGQTAVLLTPKKFQLIL